MTLDKNAEILKSLGRNYYAPDGTFMNADGTRSIFDDVDVPECNGSHDSGQIAAGDKECTACAGEEARPGALTIVENERDGNWYEFSVNGHGGLIRVVARMEDDDCDHPLGKRVRDFLLAAPPVEQHEAAPAETTEPRGYNEGFNNGWERGHAFGRARSAGISEIILSTVVRAARKGKSYVEGYGKAQQFLADAGLLVKPAAPLEGTGNGADEVDCADCGWHGSGNDLASGEDDGHGKRAVCPKCGADEEELSFAGLSRAPRTEVAGAVAQWQYRAVTPTYKGEWHNCNAEKAQLIKEQAQLAVFEVRALCEIPQPPSADAAAAPADERAALVERVLGMFEAWPKDELGPTDEPESQYRFGYNTALEDVLTAFNAAPQRRRRADALTDEQQAPALAPAIEYSYASCPDAERWSGPFDSIPAAIAEALSNNNHGQVVYVGENAPVEINHDSLAEEVVERIEEQVYEQVGELADTVGPFDEAEMKPLVNSIKQWVEQNADITCWRVEKVKGYGPGAPEYEAALDLLEGAKQ
ncbi:TPA: hypothetical protein QDB28_004039 [Burkholderia vietnamiensis]|nr:hypothetical protein [Burkholderia vietnamiensis]